MLWKSNAQLAPGREAQSDRIEHARQPSGIEIPLDQPVTAESAVGTAVEPLRERLARVVLTAMAILREFGLKGGNLMQLGAASSCNHALDGVYKTPRGTHPHTSAKAALPALVADFLDPQIIAQADDLVGQVAMQAAPVRRQLALGIRQTPAGLLIAATFPPHTLLLASASFVDAASCMVRGGWLAQQAHVLDALLESVVDHLVLPVDQGRDLLAVPTEPAPVAVRTRL
jgi:hypothetical protein